ncbi:MAG: SDR family oxidoreductase [Bacillota bacterium]|nr:SDR family oxidoreductase [Bacillota bacterium]
MEEDRKVVLVTGASSGIGKATAIYLSERGIKVYGTSRNPNVGSKQDNAGVHMIKMDATEAAADSELDGSGVHMLKMDVTDAASVKNAISEVMRRENRIDAVFNNAGSGISGALEDTNLEEFKELFEANFFGMVRVVNEVLPHMRKAGKGIVINSSSIGGVIGLPYQGVYSSTKFAVEGYSEALSKEVKRFGIKVCMVEPGDFRTGFTASRRFSKATSKDSAYYEDFLKTVSAFEKDELNGCNPKMIGKVIFRIVNSKRPRLRYPVGMVFQKIILFMKKFLPGRFYEKLIIFYYMGRGIQTNKEMERVDKRLNL